MSVRLCYTVNKHNMWAVGLRMYCGSGTGGLCYVLWLSINHACYICIADAACALPCGNTFHREMTSWPPS